MSETTWPESTDKTASRREARLIGFDRSLSILAVLTVFLLLESHTWPRK